MHFNRARLGVLLTAGILVHIAGAAVAHRIALYLLVPEPCVSMECFDILRPGMARDQVLVTIDPHQLGWDLVGMERLGVMANGREVLTFDKNGLDIELVLQDGILIDGTATIGGRLVRAHLEPRDPILDAVRQGLCRLDTAVNQLQPLMCLTYLVACVAAVGLVGVLLAARRAARRQHGKPDALLPAYCNPRMRRYGPS